MSEYETRQAEPVAKKPHVDNSSIHTKPKQSPPPPDYRLIVHGFDRFVPLIKQGDIGTINGIASQVIAHILNTPVKGIFDWTAMPAEMPPWWPSLSRPGMPAGPNVDAGTAVLIDKALQLVTGYRTYCFFTMAHDDAIVRWNAEAHAPSPDPQRLDELERPLRHMRYMQSTLDALAREVFEGSR